MRAGSFSSQILSLWDRIIPDVIAEVEGWAMTPDLGVETAPLGWKAEQGLARGGKLCACTRVCVHARTHTHTHTIAGWLTSTNLSGAAKKKKKTKKNTLQRVCIVVYSVHRFLVYRNIINESDVNLPFWMPDPSIWGLKAPKISHPGSFLWCLAMRKQLVYPYFFSFPYRLTTKPQRITHIN